MPWAIASLVTVTLAVYEWARYAWKLPHDPWTFTVLAVSATSFTAWRFFSVRKQMRLLKLGISGEVAVGQFLDRLHAEQYQVFHDVRGHGFNLDHVLIGPAGVFTVETKTWNKPHSNAKVNFDGERLLVAGKEPDRDPVVQARAQAAWLRTQLRESTGKDFEVWPVIVFPGWFVEATSTSQRKLWVLEPKALPSFLKNEPLTLNAEDRKLASFHLSRMIRSAED
ncbi:MAG: nuclease-related domain-containing protein [Casimicrobium sp.]